MELDFSRPGKPTDNAAVKSFNGRLRQECLNAHWFLSLAEAQAKIEAWRQDYNDSRPHSALEWATPADFARRCRLQAARRCQRSRKFLPPSGTDSGTGSQPPALQRRATRRCNPRYRQYSLGKIAAPGLGRRSHFPHDLTPSDRDPAEACYCNASALLSESGIKTDNALAGEPASATLTSPSLAVLSSVHARIAGALSVARSSRRSAHNWIIWRR